MIEPLFLTDLKNELDDILKLKQQKKRNDRLIEFSNKLRSLNFLDPACGCGNFLIITYRELRRLELKVLHAQHGGSMALGLEIQPSIPLNNFYGIEIDEWPTRIAEVAMWLTQHQMNVEFAKTFGEEPDLLPLKEHANIHHANALELDWSQVVEPQNLNYIIGNPPFVGKNFRNKTQEASQQQVFLPEVKSWKSLDFVAGWFYKAAKFTNNTTIQTAFVSTNSICMGEQTGVLWQPMLDMGIKINFAHRTFAWDNDAKGKASVHCIIVGFAHFDRSEKWLYDYPDIKGAPNRLTVENVNPYLVDAPNAVVLGRSKPLVDVSPMVYGNKPVDGGFLFLTPDEKNDLLAKQPGLLQWIKPILGSQEFLNNGERYCLWFANASTKELRDLMQIPEVKQRIDGVKKMRLASTKAKTQQSAEIPWLFDEVRQPTDGTYILLPRVSSERRSYVPMGFFDQDTICSDANQMIPNATLYEFGILTSQIHMDWMRTVAGRLKSDYRYSAKLVYNNFPWPQTNDQQKEQIEKLAQAILDARQAEFDKDSNTSRADLYDPDLMPSALRKAHKALDKAVDKLYNPKGFKTPLDRVKHLFELYQQLVKQA
ncbi:DNA methyltransferase [Hydrogenovibrio sp. SC-1]|uniref:class I SAM-dependent DNA methyltransferase n=1 Tax=Hydrogenovibrio sp. SC-1 TaxID=2065820 RepID=UPI0018ECE21F|nr:DNA methyltransferase [Hydrogenovibrio sp. SC-1]